MKRKHIAWGSECWRTLLLQMLTSVLKRYQKSMEDTRRGWGISRDCEVHLSLWSLNSPAARGLFCWDSHSLSYIQGKCAHKRLSTILLLISDWLKQICVCACLCARSWGHKIRLGAPCLSLMLHFHKKWQISSKSVSGRFRNMIINAAKRMSLLRDGTRQSKAVWSLYLLKERPGLFHGSKKKKKKNTVCVCAPRKDARLLHVSTLCAHMQRVLRK